MEDFRDQQNGDSNVPGNGSLNDPINEQKIKTERHSVFGFFITRSRLVTLIIIATVVGGLISVFTLPRESDPEVKIPIAIVTTIFPGASPADVENLVTDEVESKLEELDDIKLVTSSSGSSVSNIVVEFEAEADLDKSIRALRDKINTVTGLPDDVDNPIVTEVRADNFAIVNFSLAGDLTDRQLKLLGEMLQDELESISGVSQVQLTGVRERQFLVTINRGALDRVGISINSVVAALADANADFPLGDLTVDGKNYNLRTVARFKTAEDVARVVVGQNGSRPITVADVAEVGDVLDEANTLSRISVAGGQSQTTVSLAVFKKTGGNIIKIVDQAKALTKELQVSGAIPAGVTVEVTSDFSVFIRKDLKTLGTSGLTTIALIFFILLLALSLGEAFIAILAVPVVFFITFFILKVGGYTINSLTLFSLVLALGLLVDTFIVIMEGIFDNMRRGYDSARASLLSVATFKKPLISGVLTTVSAFVPMLLVSGILGEYLRVLPITISITLGASLLVSLIIVPAVSSVVFRKSQGNGQATQDQGQQTQVKAHRKESALEKHVTNRLRKKYHSSIRSFLASRKKKKRFAFALAGSFILAFGLIISPVIKVELFPEVDVDFGVIDLELPAGTELAATDKVVRQIEDILVARPDVENFVSNVGLSAAGFDFGSTGSASEHVASINVNYVDFKDRKVKSYVIAEELREQLADIQVGKITVRELTSGPPTGAPIEVRVLGDEQIVLADLTARVVKALEETDGVIEIEDSRELAPADFTFRLNLDALARSGLGVGEVAGTLRTALFGVTATEVSVDGEDVDVVVEFERSDVATVQDVQNISIVNRQGQAIKLSRLADFELAPALTSISHRDFERTITVQANLEEGFSAPTVVSQVQDKVNEQAIPAGYEIKFGGEVEDIQQSFTELWYAMIVAVLLILVILVLQFNSFKQPLAILFTLPLMLIGVVIGMLILRLPFSFSTFLGLVSLAGIVVNDAIVMIDRINENRYKRKMPMREAVSDAGEARLQPIILTTVTTVIGVIPLAIADEFWFGLSTAIAFGLSFATILTLYMVPMIYLKLESPRWKPRWHRSKKLVTKIRNRRQKPLTSIEA